MAPPPPPPPIQVQTVELPSASSQRVTVWRLVEQWSNDPRTRDLLARICREERIPARDPHALARGVQRWTQKHVRYTPEREETLAAPWVTARWGIGDCDDSAALVSSVLRNAKIPSRLVAVGWGPAWTVPPLGHIYAQARPRDEWVSLETVRPVPYGFDPSAYKQRQGFAVRALPFGDR